jgi:nuclear transport factor 2 (NTF2) superfamily protein
MTRPPLPPFDETAAITKVRMAEDGWNSRDPEKVSLAYTPDCQWRNRAEIFQGRDRIVDFLTRKWVRELDYRLIKELWAFHGNRIAVRFAYEYRCAAPMPSMARRLPGFRPVSTRWKTH